MKVYLVQHGEALPEEQDPARPLSETGRAQVRKVAEFASTHWRLSVDRIYHSAKLRARQTAEIFAELLHPTEGTVQTKGLNPMDDPTFWAGQLNTLQQTVMLVGHLPHLSRLTGLLVCGDSGAHPVAFQMGGILALQRREQNQWQIRAFLVPEMLQSPEQA